MGRWIAATFGAAFGAGTAAVLVACGVDAWIETTKPTRIPGAKTTYQVDAVVPRGPYLDVLLRRADDRIRFFFPDTETCRAVLQTQALVDWSPLGTIGTVSSPIGECTVVGIGSLAAWRDRRGRATSEPVPQARTTFEVVWEDEAYALARGRFPFLNLIGWAGGYDTVALIPKTEACRELLARGVGSIRFRSSGDEPYLFPTDKGPCPLEAILQPLR